jgi:hypothetical protein
MNAADAVKKAQLKAAVPAHRLHGAQLSAAAERIASAGAQPSGGVQPSQAAAGGLPPVKRSRGFTAVMTIASGEEEKEGRCCAA